MTTLDKSVFATPRNHFPSFGPRSKANSLCLLPVIAFDSRAFGG